MLDADIVLVCSIIQFISLQKKEFLVKDLCPHNKAHDLRVDEIERETSSNNNSSSRTHFDEISQGTASELNLSIVRQAQYNTIFYQIDKNELGGSGSHDLSQLFLNHDHPSKSNTGCGRRDIVQLPCDLATANSFRKIVGLKEAVWEQVKQKRL